MSMSYEIISIKDEIVYLENDKFQINGVNIKHYHIKIQYLSIDGTAKTREASLFMPTFVNQHDCPLIMNVYYQLGPTNTLTHEYLKRGWAFLSPISLPSETSYHKKRAGLVGDELRYNMALLDMARRIKGIDNTKIAIKGGSAGGYQMLMLSITHFGIVCGYDLSGIINLSYEYKYIIENNKINDDFDKYPEKYKFLFKKDLSNSQTDIEPNLPQNYKDEYKNYPIPRIKIASVDHSISDIIGNLDIENPESEKWQELSPICHLDKICHPLLISHSTADVIVPIYQVTRKHAYATIDTDFPKEYKYHLKDLMICEKLNKPLDELIESDDVEVFVLNPYKGQYNNMLRFSSDKRVSINIIDEWKPERNFVHFRDNAKANVSDINFFDYYFSQQASDTNRLTKAKLEGLAQRYLGKLKLFEQENSFKPKLESKVFGSLSSDRLDVLLSLLSYLGLSIYYQTNSMQLYDNDYSDVNLNLLYNEYNKLEENMKFLNNDIQVEFITSRNNLLKVILHSVSYYASECKENELSRLAKDLYNNLF